MPGIGGGSEIRIRNNYNSACSLFKVKSRHVSGSIGLLFTFLYKLRS